MSVQTLNYIIYKKLFEFLSNEYIQRFLAAAFDADCLHIMWRAADYHFCKRLNTFIIRAPRTEKAVNQLVEFLELYGRYMRDLTIIYAPDSLLIMLQKFVRLTAEKLNRVIGDWCMLFCKHIIRLTLNLKNCEDPAHIRLPHFPAMKSLTILHAHLCDNILYNYLRSGLPQLDALQIIDNDFTEGAFLMDLLTFDIHPTCMRLNLKRLSSESFEKYACNIFEHQSLRELHLEDNVYNRNLLQVRWFLFNPGLREASVPVGMDPANTQQLCDMMQQLPQLRRLNLTIRPEDGGLFDRIVRPVGENASDNLRLLHIRLLGSRPLHLYHCDPDKDVGTLPQMPPPRPQPAQSGRQRNRYSAFEWSRQFRPCRQIRTLWLSAMRPLDELLISVPHRFPDVWELRLVDVLCPLRWDSMEQYLGAMERGPEARRLLLRRVRIQVLGDEELGWNVAGSRLIDRYAPVNRYDKCTEFLAAIELYMFDYAVALKDMCLKRNIFLYTEDLRFV